MTDTTGSRTVPAQDTENAIPSFDWEDTPRSAGSNDLSEDFTCKASLAFDQWFACLTVGKQLSNYYRYGEKRGCGKHWSKMSLCMKMKLRSEESGKVRLDRHIGMRRYRQPYHKQIWHLD
ncbi:hypothetical protein LPJ73_003230 [Coemansia sp. RSA 2703]|nr:hypothetical protein LPJ73_003230 [Coemansia sp. RSA 2703]